MSKKIIVSNRLPITIKKVDDGLKYSPSSGGLATGLGSIYKEGDNIWIGWPGVYPETGEDREEITKNLIKENMRPIFLTEQDVKDYYEGYSNSTLWPLFHYFTQYVEYVDKYWDSYVEVNKKFRDEILKYAEPDDIIWIHDYQLLLLPQLLRKELPDATIGFFNHIPFPSYEIFRLLPWRSQILDGILGADMIGFHTYDDMRHFLSAVSRITGIDHSMGHLKTDDRIITVDALPMGIDYEKFSNSAHSEETQAEVKKFRGYMGDQRLILSIDRLDYSKGIPQRLTAFDKFLEEYPDYQGKVSLILLVVPSREHVDHYKELKEELDLLVGRINGKYSSMNWTPIHYFYRSLDFPKLCALYYMADVALVTPLRDGMNLVCKEFIASKLDQKGVLILSEMAGSAKEMSDALLINPNDLGNIVDALHKALNMPIKEQKSRNADMQTKLQRYNIHRWVEVFMEGLTTTKEKQKEMTAKLLTKKSRERMVENYKKSKKRLLLLDYDGTLMPFRDNPKDVSPDEELYSLLERITSDEKNRVVMISGRDRETLDDWLGDFKLEFIAEHGVWLKEYDGDWYMIDDLRQEWRDEITPILNLYVDRTPGTFIEKKDYSMVWHYRRAEAGLGELRARELISNLQYLTSNMDIQILEGNKIVEVKNAGVNKGRAAIKWLSKDKWDFIFAVGDDYTDEDTFHVMPENAFTLKVGLKATEARYNLKRGREIRDLLNDFMK